jgi:FkbM family methyltransferase
MRRTRLGTLGFHATRGLLYRVLVPLMMRSGPLEPIALRLYRLLLYGRTSTMAGISCPIDVDGLTLWYDTDEPSNTIRGLAAGGYEQPIADLFATVLRPGMTVLDVGAHIGYFTLVAATHVGPTGRVWSFEPDPANRASLERNVDANGMADRVTVVPLAAAAAMGESALYRVSGDTGSSTLYPSSGAFGEPIAVRTTSLDAWAKANGWPSVDLVKIDTEGAEGAVVAGMAELLARNPDAAVVLEYQADTLEAAGVDPTDLLEQLLAVGSGHVELLDARGNRRIGRSEASWLVRRSRWSPLNLAIREPSSQASR